MSILQRTFCRNQSQDNIWRGRRCSGPPRRAATVRQYMSRLADDLLFSLAGGRRGSGGITPRIPWFARAEEEEEVGVCPDDGEDDASKQHKVQVEAGAVLAAAYTIAAQLKRHLHGGSSSAPPPRSERDENNVRRIAAGFSPVPPLVGRCKLAHRLKAHGLAKV